jgi:hypothetical protein
VVSGSFHQRSGPHDKLSPSPPLVQSISGT